MPRRCPPIAVCCLFLLPLIALLAGCTIGGGGRTSRGKVSDVARAAGEDGGDEARVRTERSPDPWDLDPYEDEPDEGLPVTALLGVQGAGGGSARPAASAQGTPGRRPNLMLWGSRARPAGDALDPFTSVTVAYSSFRGTQVRTHLGGYYGAADPGGRVLGDGVPLADALDDVSEFGLDAGVRRYLTHEHTLMGVYGLLGARLGVLRWSYARPVRVSDQETITSDALWQIAPYAGLGVSPLQAGPAHLGLNVTWGVRFPIQQTLRGFENDLFRDTGEMKANLEASFFF